MMMFLVATIAFPIILLVCLCTLKTIGNHEMTVVNAEKADTAPLNRQLSSRELNQLAFAKRLNEFLISNFPGSFQYYNDNPCSAYENDIFYVNIVFANGNREKVFIQKKPSLYGASFQLLKSDNIPNPVSVPAPTKEPPANQDNKDKHCKNEKKDDGKNSEEKEVHIESPKQDKDSNDTTASSDDCAKWLEQNLPKMLELMQVAEKNGEDAFLFQVPNNKEIREALEYERFYVIDNDETSETYVSF